MKMLPPGTYLNRYPKVHKIIKSQTCKKILLKVMFLNHSLFLQYNKMIQKLIRGLRIYIYMLVASHLHMPLHVAHWHMQKYDKTKL